MNDTVIYLTPSLVKQATRSALKRMLFEVAEQVSLILQTFEDEHSIFRSNKQSIKSMSAVKDVFYDVNFADPVLTATMLAPKIQHAFLHREMGTWKQLIPLERMWNDVTTLLNLHKLMLIEERVCSSSPIIAINPHQVSLFFDELNDIITKETAHQA